MNTARADNENARLQPGVKNTQQTHIAADSADNVSEKQPKKPEIDLQSWAKLGGIGKPIRTASKAKKSWIRGAI